MPAAKAHADYIAHIRESMNQARNEQQKAILLKEAVRLGKQRFERAAEESRKECKRARDLQIKRTRKRRS